jgi:hypothetical protein
MDTSVFGLDLPAWLSGTSDGLYLASFCFAVIAMVLVSCIVVKILTAENHSVARKDKTPLAH